MVEWEDYSFWTTDSKNPLTYDEYQQAIKIFREFEDLIDSEQEQTESFTLATRCSFCEKIFQVTVSSYIYYRFQMIYSKDYDFLTHVANLLNQELNKHNSSQTQNEHKYFEIHPLDYNNIVRSQTTEIEKWNSFSIKYYPLTLKNYGHKLMCDLVGVEEESSENHSNNHQKNFSVPEIEQLFEEKIIDSKNLKRVSVLLELFIEQFKKKVYFCTNECINRLELNEDNEYFINSLDTKSTSYSNLEICALDSWTTYQKYEVCANNTRYTNNTCDNNTRDDNIMPDNIIYIPIDPSDPLITYRTDPLFYPYKVKSQNKIIRFGEENLFPEFFEKVSLNDLICNSCIVNNNKQIRAHDESYIVPPIVQCQNCKNYYDSRNFICDGFTKIYCNAILSDTSKEKNYVHTRINGDSFINYANDFFFVKKIQKKKSVKDYFQETPVDYSSDVSFNHSSETLFEYKSNAIMAKIPMHREHSKLINDEIAPFDHSNDHLNDNSNDNFILYNSLSSLNEKLNEEQYDFNYEYVKTPDELANLIGVKLKAQDLICAKCVLDFYKEGHLFLFNSI
jgi:hypothetical protein